MSDSRQAAPSNDATKLWATEEHFRLLVESVRDYAIFALDARGHVATWNAGAERIKGYTRDEIVGQHFSKFYPEADIQDGKCERELDVATREGRFEDEGWRVRKDGTRFWANVVITALRTPDGALVGFAKVTRDLTERVGAERDRLARAKAEQEAAAKDALIATERRARAEVDEARELLATTLRSIGDAVMTSDADGLVTMMNPVAEELTGWPERDAIGRPMATVFNIVNERTRRAVESPVARVLRDGVVVGLANHTILVSRSGTDVPIDDSGAPIRDAGGRIVGVVLVFRNASKEKTEQLRRAFLADLSTALSSVVDSHAMLGAIARLAVPRLADWCAVDVVEPGREAPTQVAVAHTDPAKVELAREWAKRGALGPDAATGATSVLRTGSPELYETITDDQLVASTQDPERLRLARELRLRSAMLVPIRRSDRTVGVITLVQAESGRHYSEDDLAFADDLGRRAALALENARLFEESRRAREAADEANRAKDQFLAGISHELRTPLNAIVGWSNLMAGHALEPEKHSRAVDAIVRNASTMTHLIEDLLDISRIVSGKMRLETAPLDLVPVIDAAIEVVRSTADAKQIRIDCSLETDGQKAVGDATRLQQVAWNLLHNAVKFTPSGGVIRVRLRASDFGFELSVSDSGQGIDPQFLPHVFDAFRQADIGIARSGGGLGLGLAITRHIVEAHGGWIAAHSDGPGHGTTFVVRLPISPELAGARDEPRAAASAPFEPPRELDGRHVLVVDDDADTRTMIGAMLERCGTRVTAASSVVEALAAIEREVPDVIVSDIGMPSEDGYDLIRRVRALPPDKGGNVPATALTAYARADDRRRALAAGYTAHLAKPVEPGELCAIVAALARLASRR
jgi:PAS domain S-box-containing protein